MARIVIYGKGGIGKSTVAASLSVVYAMKGLKVLHVGCDPKHDSAASLVPGGLVETFLQKHRRVAGIRDLPPLTAEDILARGRHGIECVEAGGPEPGFGCAGRGIALMLEAFEGLDLLGSGRHDVAIFDALGDIVCGGFAAPMRKGFAELAVVLVSEELMSLYAANNLARSIRAYAGDGARLAGLVVNLRDPEADKAKPERFAKLLGTRILGFVPRDPAVREAENARAVTAVELVPSSPFAKSLRSLAETLLKIRRQDCPVPTPMDDEAFRGDW
ncbi:MAG: nitrogenase iron protein [Elusimicrobia bacterium]|nr:nitrogenase iron protein [Elusimicrobiota bacterium]